ncbi:MAG TPA: exodeoxyribonuclease VII large subunit [Candidatus Saccharimonadales bacterium]|nr:exodeoxyribonuclease VII large subunit [Candidatus Saccharimonadales bacterium]
MTDLILSVSDFIAVFNQTIEYAYPSVTIVGELANFRISKSRWIYFDLKDENAIVRFFGSIYQLPGPLEDGMLLQVKGMPRLHPLYGFSVTVAHIQPSGQGSIKRARTLLQAKLAGEGLFDADRKRTLPYPPQSIGLITSAESAAFRDFIKVINARWGGMEITLIDVQVQGQAAAEQITTALDVFNQQATPPEIIVLTRGGGSAEDLQAFSTEQVTRAVARSRIPTLVAIGHEVDISLAELAADLRGSTPSNAAELIVPDRKALLSELETRFRHLSQFVHMRMEHSKIQLEEQRAGLDEAILQQIAQAHRQLEQRNHLLQAFNPQAALRRGYALVRKGSNIVSSGQEVYTDDELTMQLIDADVLTIVKQVTMNVFYGKEAN